MAYYIEIKGIIAEQHRIARALDDEPDRIKRGTLRWKLHGLHDRAADLQSQAAQEFAASNGWRHSRRGFYVSTLIRGGVHAGRGDDEYNQFWDHRLFDHPVYFREVDRPYRPVAMVGQPYNTTTERATDLAGAIGLELHAASNSESSWWFPGQTRFFVFTRPGQAVKFLTEQILQAA